MSEYRSSWYQKSVREGAVVRDPDYRRIRKYRGEALRQGASEEDSWWCAMAAEIHFKEKGQSSRWIKGLVAKELEWLRNNRAVLDRLDGARFRPIKDDIKVEQDDGWSETA